jgi:hypothetical protein
MEKYMAINRLRKTMFTLEMPLKDWRYACA